MNSKRSNKISSHNQHTFINTLIKRRLVSAKFLGKLQTIIIHENEDI